MNLSQIEYFAAVCEDGSISRAAQRLYVSQQAVSAAIAALERELGAELLVRTSKGVAVTEKGGRALVHAREALAAVEDMRRSVGGDAGDVEGESVVRLAYLPDIFDNIGTEKLASLVETDVQTQGGFRLRAFPAESSLCLQLVTQRSADCALVTAAAPPEGFRSRLVAATELALLVPAGHPLAGKDRVGVSELRDGRLAISSYLMRDYALFMLMDRCRERGFELSFDDVKLPAEQYRSYLVEHGRLGVVLDGYVPERDETGYRVVRFAHQDQVPVNAYLVFRDDAPAAAFEETIVRAVGNLMRSDA